MAFAAWGIYFLTLAFTNDRLTIGLDYFWPGVICFLTGLGLLIGIVAKSFAIKSRCEERHDQS